MRTRTSVRNQNILFKALFKPASVAVEPVETKCCFNCDAYPKNGRARGECLVSGTMVNGRTMNRDCFRSRSTITQQTEK